MSAPVLLEVETEPLARIEADLAVAGCFADQRPLRGGAGAADWRLCGRLSALLVQGRASGAWGESVLIPTRGRLRAPRVLLLGLGGRATFDAETHQRAVREAVSRVIGLGAASAALDVPAPVGEVPLGQLAASLVAGIFAAVGEGQPRLVLRIPAAADTPTPLVLALERAVAGHPRGGIAVRRHEAARPTRPPGGGRAPVRPPAPALRSPR